MTDQDIHLALQEESDSILPSSGFIDVVMARVEAEAVQSSPIGFPWRRALPGVGGLTLVLAALLVALVQAWSMPQAGVGDPYHLLALCASAADVHQAMLFWTSIALLLGVFCLAATRWLAIRASILRFHSDQQAAFFTGSNSPKP